MVKMTARGFDLAEKTKAIIEKELKKIKKMLPKAASFDITISKKVNGYNCDIMVKDAGSFIKGDAVADSVDSSVNFAVDALKRKVRKLKTFLVDKKRKQGVDVVLNSANGFFEGSSFVDSNYKDDCEKEKIVKTNKILLQMMDDEEAVAQMETLGYNHFIYIGDDGNTRLIYKLDKEGYGLLICDR